MINEYTQGKAFAETVQLYPSGIYAYSAKNKTPDKPWNTYLKKHKINIE